jgi:non-ribosomal peptide synthetase component E (peptide arylation enzyme)
LFRLFRQKTPDREALTDGTLTYRELAHGIDRTAARLRDLGIGQGDVVAIQPHRSDVSSWHITPLVGRRLSARRGVYAGG